MVLDRLIELERRMLRLENHPPIAESLRNADEEAATAHAAAIEKPKHDAEVEAAKAEADRLDAEAKAAEKA